MQDNSINNNLLPQHVAIIMDGNGRWAKQRGKIRSFGHKNAIQAVKNAIEASKDFGIKYLTLFAFSTENWNRPKKEVDTLMQLLVSTMRKELKSLLEQEISVNTIGVTAELPTKVQKELEEVIEATKHFTQGTLTIALNYGSKQEIIEATKKVAQLYKDNQISEEEITEQLFSDQLYTQGIPEVDLLIRTSGEHRISNFLLWQIAYAELYFTDILWPDFTKEDFLKALQHYQSKERRFGKTSEQITN